MWHWVIISVIEYEQLSYGNLPTMGGWVRREKVDGFKFGGLKVCATVTQGDIILSALKGRVTYVIALHVTVFYA